MKKSDKDEITQKEKRADKELLDTTNWIFDDTEKFGQRLVRIDDRSNILVFCSLDIKNGEVLDSVATIGTNKGISDLLFRLMKQREDVCAIILGETSKFIKDSISEELKNRNASGDEPCDCPACTDRRNKQREYMKKHGN